MIFVTGKTESVLREQSFEEGRKEGRSYIESLWEDMDDKERQDIESYRPSEVEWINRMVDQWMEYDWVQGCETGWEEGLSDLE